jgi:hypothetical protein
MYAQLRPDVHCWHYRCTSALDGGRCPISFCCVWEGATGHNVISMREWYDQQILAALDTRNVPKILGSAFTVIAKYIVSYVYVALSILTAPVRLPIWSPNNTVRLSFLWCKLQSINHRIYVMSQYLTLSYSCYVMQDMCELLLMAVRLTI